MPGTNPVRDDDPIRLESLEKQTSLQMSQVFPFPCIGDQLGLAFQGFYSEAASLNRCCSHGALLPLHLAGLTRGLAG